LELEHHALFDRVKLTRAGDKAIAWERAVKIQEVILGALGKKITGGKRRRLSGSRIAACGAGGSATRSTATTGGSTGGGEAEPEARAPGAGGSRAAVYIREKYADLHVRHFHEKLQEAHGIKLKLHVGEAGAARGGLVKQGRKRGVHRKRRARRPLPGMLLHLTGAGIKGFRTSAGTT